MLSIDGLLHVVLTADCLLIEVDAAWQVGKTALTEVYTKGGSKFPKNYSMVCALCSSAGSAGRRPDMC